jgi:hypothetical protein
MEHRREDRDGMDSHVADLGRNGLSAHAFGKRLRIEVDRGTPKGRGVSSKADSSIAPGAGKIDLPGFRGVNRGATNQRNYEAL